MSINEANTIDGIGKNKKENELVLLITDHLTWDDEYNHLLLLQDKINAYIHFVESNQYLNMYPNEHFEKYKIEIHFKYAITNNCSKFLNVVSEQINPLRIMVTTVIVSG